MKIARPVLQQTLPAVRPVMMAIALWVTPVVNVLLVFALNVPTSVKDPAPSANLDLIFMVKAFAQLLIQSLLCESPRLSDMR